MSIAKTYMSLVELEILNSLSKVNDPEFNMDIVNLGLVYDIRLKDGNLEVDVTMTDPACPLIDQIVAAIRTTLENDFGLSQSNIIVNVVWSPRWTWEMMTDEGKIAMGFAV